MLIASLLLSATQCSLPPKHHLILRYSKYALSISSLLRSVRQRLPRLRTDLEHPTHLVEQLLILDRLAAFERLDVVGWHVAALRQLRLRQLEALLRAARFDRLAKLRVDLLRRHHVVGPVDLGQPLTLGAFVGLGRR